MSVEAAGAGGSGEVTVYTVSTPRPVLLETLCFTVNTSVSGNGHMVRILLESPSGEHVARLDDLNVGGDGQENFYTYGIGLNASACTLPAGLAVTDALPWTDLVEGTKIIVRAIDNAGVLITGDAISDVLLHFDDPPVKVKPPALLPLTLLPGSAAA